MPYAVTTRSTVAWSRCTRMTTRSLRETRRSRNQSRTLRLRLGWRVGPAVRTATLEQPRAGINPPRGPLGHRDFAWGCLAQGGSGARTAKWCKGDCPQMAGTVLFVDDEPDILSSLQLLVEEAFPDFAVATAHSGQAAL